MSNGGGGGGGGGSSGGFGLSEKERDAIGVRLSPIERVIKQAREEAKAQKNIPDNAPVGLSSLVVRKKRAAQLDDGADKIVPNSLFSISNLSKTLGG